ncbi:hypothetical protein KDAU_15770 [Dictyobacter aurantiacus]|uniref:Uncharacterized protein n=1 Tax=Dictyobacter aurantiacus TaxID=1936993 RepID=A0A401ZC07_9CHLR|nr:hypothetical protein KDAU_15770 [Dictyobacter aurantiacus]
MNLWRQLVKASEPVLFLTLTEAGQTVEEATRALTTFMQALRCGSKGRFRGHVGAHLAYSVEYRAVLERHANVDTRDDVSVLDNRKVEGGEGNKEQEWDMFSQL